MFVSFVMLMVDKRVGVRGMSEEWEWEIEKGEINRLILIKPHIKLTA